MARVRIGDRAEFVGASRLLIRSDRYAKKKEFHTEVAYDLQAKSFSLPGTEEHVRIGQADFGKVGDVDLPLPGPTPNLGAGAMTRFILICDLSSVMCFGRAKPHRSPITPLAAAGSPRRRSPAP